MRCVAGPNFFFLSIPPPPRSTLFPYTTLFRSDHGVGPRRAGRQGTDILDYRVGQALALDRKSTRLNSSHTVISYAVFCLKKKKWTDHGTVPHRETHGRPTSVLGDSLARQTPCA